MEVLCEGGPCDGELVEVEEGAIEFFCPKLQLATEPLPPLRDPERKLLHKYRVTAIGRARYVGPA
jgi:hypothetical protein